jgi:hypothetical protein
MCGNLTVRCFEDLLRIKDEGIVGTHWIPLLKQNALKIKNSTNLKAKINDLILKLNYNSHLITKEFGLKNINSLGEEIICKDSTKKQNSE